MRKIGRVRMEAGGTVLFSVLQRNDECVNFEGILQTFFFTTFYCIFLTWESVKLLHGSQASVLLNAVLCGIGNIRF